MCLGGGSTKVEMPKPQPLPPPIPAPPPPKRQAAPPKILKENSKPDIRIGAAKGRSTDAPRSRGVGFSTGTNQGLNLD